MNIKPSILLVAILSACTNPSPNKICGACNKEHIDNYDFTRCSMQIVASSISIYEEHTGRKINKIEDAGQYFYSTTTGRGHPKDIWMKDLKYDSKNRTLISSGKDKVFDTNDDIQVVIPK